MYIDNGGGDVQQTYSMLSVVDTTAGKQLADLKIEGNCLISGKLTTKSSNGGRATRAENTQLRRKLAEAEEHLPSLVESKEASDEEFQSVNEEILSANEGITKHERGIGNLERGAPIGE